MLYPIPQSISRSIPRHDPIKTRENKETAIQHSVDNLYQINREYANWSPETTSREFIYNITLLFNILFPQIKSDSSFMPAKLQEAIVLLIISTKKPADLLISKNDITAALSMLKKMGFDELQNAIKNYEKNDFRFLLNEGIALYNQHAHYTISLNEASFTTPPYTPCNPNQFLTVTGKLVRQNEFNGWIHCPTEVISAIIQHISPKDFFNLSLTCHFLTLQFSKLALKNYGVNKDTAPLKLLKKILPHQLIKEKSPQEQFFHPPNRTEPYIAADEIGQAYLKSTYRLSPLTIKKINNHTVALDDAIKKRETADKLIKHKIKELSEEEEYKIKNQEVAQLIADELLTVDEVPNFSWTNLQAMQDQWIQTAIDKKHLSTSQLVNAKVLFYGWWRFPFPYAILYPQIQAAIDNKQLTITDALKIRGYTLIALLHYDYCKEHILTNASELKIFISLPEREVYRLMHKWTKTEKMKFVFDQ